MNSNKVQLAANTEFEGENHMKAGKAFEILVKRILINVGFSEVQSDGTYI